MSLKRFQLDDVSNCKIIIKFEAFNVSVRLSQKYDVLQLSYETTRYFNPASHVAIQRMLSDRVHVQVSSVVQLEPHEYDVKKKHQKP